MQRIPCCIATTGVEIGPDSISRLGAAALLAIVTVSRELDPGEAVVREDFMCMHKMETEGGLKEDYAVLGWKIDTRKLTDTLPENICLAWSAQIEKIFKVGKVKVDDLESLIGSLNHTAYVIPLAHHLLSRFCHLHSKVKNKWTHLRISA